MDTKKKTTKTHFNMFKKFVRGYATKWGINDMALYFSHEELDNAYAINAGNVLKRTSTLGFTTEWDEYGGRKLCEKEIKRTAKHEVTHLLLAELQACAYERFIDSDTVERAFETLVVKLQNIIPD